MLKKLFIKDYKNTENPAVRNRYGSVAGIFGIFTNILLFLIKLAIGLISGSITVVADAINNLSDAGSSVLTLIGFKLAGRPADEDHPYGHARYEQIIAMFIAVLVLCIGVLFAKGSIDKIITPAELTLNLTTYIVLLVAVAIKLIQMLTYLDFAKAINSDAIKAAALDSRNDIISSGSVLIGMVVMGVFKINIDGYIGLVVSVFLIYSAAKMVKETISPMLGTPPSPEMVESIKNTLLSSDAVIDCHDLIVHNYGAGANFASVHAEVDAKGDIIAIHDEIDNIENKVFKELGVALTIHMDPVDYSNPRRQQLLELTNIAIKKYDADISLHDFRLVDGPTHTNVLFDIIEPFGKKYDLAELRKFLYEEFSAVEGTFFFVITVDKKYA